MHQARNLPDEVSSKDEGNLEGDGKDGVDEY